MLFRFSNRFSRCHMSRVRQDQTSGMSVVNSTEYEVQLRWPRTCYCTRHPIPKEQIRFTACGAVKRADSTHTARPRFPSDIQLPTHLIYHRKCQRRQNLLRQTSTSWRLGEGWSEVMALDRKKVMTSSIRSSWKDQAGLTRIRLDSLEAFKPMLCRATRLQNTRTIAGLIDTVYCWLSLRLCGMTSLERLRGLSSLLSRCTEISMVRMMPCCDSADSAYSFGSISASGTPVFLADRALWRLPWPCAFDLVATVPADREIE